MHLHSKCGGSEMLAAATGCPSASAAGMGLNVALASMYMASMCCRLAPILTAPSHKLLWHSAAASRTALRPHYPTKQAINRDSPTIRQSAEGPHTALQNRGNRCWVRQINAGSSSLSVTMLYAWQGRIQPTPLLAPASCCGDSLTESTVSTSEGMAYAPPHQEELKGGDAA